MTGIGRILTIALLAIANTQAIGNFRVGDTVNLSEKYSGQVIVSDIFNGFNGSRFIEKKYDNSYNYKMSYQTCIRFESLIAHSYPKVFIDEELSDRASSKLFDHLLQRRDEYLGVNKNYVNDQNFKYGIVKICMTIEMHNLNIMLMDDDYFLEVVNDGLYSTWINETVVFRLKRDNETHYVSSVSTGACLIQISINDAIKCKNIDPNAPGKAADFFKTSIYRSPITFTDVNRQHEETIDQYYFLNDLDYSLFTFTKAEHFHQCNILSKFENKGIVSLILRPLPELPSVSESQRQNISLPLTNLKKRDHISPSDEFNLEELLTSRSGLVTTKNFLMNTNNGFTSSFTTYNYSSCRTHIENEAPKLENGKLNIFEEILKQQNYGIDPKNLNPEMTCLKMTFCLRLKSQMLEFSSMVVIKLNENSKNNIKYNIFEGKNITLWFSNGDETHFATGTEKGECLSQMLIFPDEADTYFGESILHDDPLLRSKILSATHNCTLEEEMRSFLNNDLRRIIRPRESNITQMQEIFKILEQDSLINSALINLYLIELI
ncbi:hypothetical protein KQX54_004213 [Cotesia glomerata]|uniref:Uncharacterized protein n=1 Tax=Cotesia glomerata TaxID=32391 RepID=A0AAV7ILU3_COTGL|nr:hypothetical protein KQX54_004213 [Cotesia glomerata]